MRRLYKKTPDGCWYGQYFDWEEHVDQDRGWLLLPGTKTKKFRRRVPISDSLRDELARNWQPSG